MAQARGDMRLLRGRRAAHWLWPSFRRPDQALLTPANAPHAFPEPVSCAILSQAVGGWAAHLGNVGSHEPWPEQEQSPEPHTKFLILPVAESRGRQRTDP